MSSGKDPMPDDMQRAVARCLDDEMTPAEAREFESRVAGDPDLAEMLRQAQEMRALFAVGRTEASLVPDAEFKSRVIRAVSSQDHRLPSYEDWQQEWEREAQMSERRRLAVWGQAIAAAALILLALGVMVYTGLLGSADSGRLEASPAEIRNQMRLLDEAISRRAERADAKGRDR